MSWGSFALCPMPPPLLLNVHTHTYAHMPQQNNTREYTCSKHYRSYRSQVLFVGTVLPFEMKEGCTPLGSPLLSSPLSLSLCPVLLPPLSRCSPLFVPVVLLSSSSSSSSSGTKITYCVFTHTHKKKTTPTLDDQDVAEESAGRCHRFR